MDLNGVGSIRTGSVYGSHFQCHSTGFCIRKCLDMGDIAGFVNAKRNLTNNTVPVCLCIRGGQMTALCGISQWIAFPFLRLLKIGNQYGQTEVLSGHGLCKVVNMWCIQTVISTDLYIVDPYHSYTGTLQIEQDLPAHILRFQMNLLGVPCISLIQIRICQSSCFHFVRKCSLLCHRGGTRQRNRIIEIFCIKCFVDAGTACVKLEIPDTL